MFSVWVSDLIVVDGLEVRLNDCVLSNGVF